MAKKPSDWVRIPVNDDIRRIAQERCRGYNLPTSKSQDDVFRDCYIQGLLDGVSLVRLRPELLDTKP